MPAYINRLIDAFRFIAWPPAHLAEPHKPMVGEERKTISEPSLTPVNIDDYWLRKVLVVWLTLDGGAKFSASLILQGHVGVVYS